MSLRKTSTVYFYLLEKDGNYWLTTTEHNGWTIIDSFEWMPNHTETPVIDWLVSLVKDDKITIDDAIRVGFYYGRGK